MRRLSTAVALLLVALPASLVAQSSQFGVRGVGVPGHLMSARATGTAGAFALFDPESARNPAALAEYEGLTATLSTMQNWRTSENPAGSGSAKTQLFPLFSVGGPVPRSRLFWAAGVSNYADRDFGFASVDTLQLGGEDQVVHDTTISEGGLSDFRVAGAYRMSSRLAVGLGLHVVSGSNRVRVQRAFEDTTYQPVGDRAELAYDAFGVDLGAVARLRPGLRLAAALRWDGESDLAVDSTDVGTIDLPLWLQGAVEWVPSRALRLAGQAAYRGWGVADEAFRQGAGAGALDTWSVAAGGEYLRNPLRPAHLPLRFGAHWSQLPFPLVEGQQGSEWGLAVGTGLRFAQDRGGADLALQRVWRSEGSDYRETAWLLTIGISVRP